MKSIKIKTVFLAVFLAALAMKCRGQLISVQSGTDSNGVFFYNVSAGDEALTFGGSGMLVTKIPSKGIIGLEGPAGWTSEVESLELATWFCTNDVCWLPEEPLTFSISSSISAWTNYSSESELYPGGMVIGEVYDTNGTRYSNIPGTNNIVMSDNIVGYEKFNFLGPIVPEPNLILSFYFFAIFLRFFVHSR